MNAVEALKEFKRFLEEELHDWDAGTEILREIDKAYVKVLQELVSPSQPREPESRSVSRKQDPETVD